MIFSGKNKAQKPICETTMMKLEEMTGKLPSLERENHKSIKARNELSITNKILDVFRKFPNHSMYGEVLETVLKITKSAYGVFGYIDSNGAFACPSMTKNVWDKCQMEDKDIIFPKGTWGNSIWGRAITEKRALYSNQPFKVPEGHIQIHRAMMVPIIYGTKVIGLFEIANKKTDYTKDDQDILKQVARLISPILMARLERDGVYKETE